MTRRPIITLLTDFGNRDGFIGVMKGVMLQIVPDAHLVDISHELSAYSIPQAAFLNQWAFSYFPPGAVHLCVVDPGVGTARRALALETQGHIFVAPDNGVLSPLLKGPEPYTLVSLTNPSFWLGSISNTFHGRDIFSPAAAHLAKGVPIAEMGEPVDNPVIIPYEPPRLEPDGIQCRIRYIDRFGNLSTDLDRPHFEQWAEEQKLTHDQVVVLFHGGTIRGISSTYGVNEPGELTAVFNGYDYLEIAVTVGNAAQRTGLGLNAGVQVRPVSS